MYFTSNVAYGIPRDVLSDALPCFNDPTGRLCLTCAPVDNNLEHVFAHHHQSHMRPFSLAKCVEVTVVEIPEDALSVCPMWWPSARGS